MRRRPNNRSDPANPSAHLPPPLPLPPQPHPVPRSQHQTYHQHQQQPQFQKQQQPSHHISPQKTQQQTSYPQNRPQPHHISPQHIQKHLPHPQSQQPHQLSPQYIPQPPSYYQNRQQPPPTQSQQQPHQLSPQHNPQPPSYSQNRHQPLHASPQRIQQRPLSHSQNRQQPHHLSPQQQPSHSQIRPQSHHLSPQHNQKTQNLQPPSTNTQSLQISPQRIQHQNRPPSVHTSPQKNPEHPYYHQNPQQTKQSHLQVPHQQPPVMANLNFQQAPRSLASGGVGSRSLVGGVSGHVTPTFGGALSPGRGSTAMPGGAPPSMASRSTLFGQRAFADRRVPMPTTLAQPNSNSMSSMANLTRFNAGNNYHSVFGEGGDTSTPPLLDLSEFPSLTARGAGDQAPAAAPPPPGSKPYVGMVKQPTSEQSEFTMSSEDFPALPGTSTTGGVPAAPTQPGPPAPALTNPEYTNHNADKPRKGIQTSPDGKVTNIPETMIPNQFGIVGLLTFIRAAESDPSLVSLALGQDLTALGLNLNSPDNLYLTFAGPWADTPCRPQDMDYHVPPEYLINGSIREKLAPLRLNRYKEDLLFYLFYCFVGDVLQIAAAAELYNREWRYHMEEKVWISQAPGMPMVEKTSTYERGTYYFFDAHNWRKVAKEFHLDYSKLEGRPQLPPHVVT